ncbi:MAG: DUF1659 domain-containing protein [Tissierellia bacterium]|nr:DUF1659 domain-containing protein [Tissierellia bacterium]
MATLEKNKKSLKLLLEDGQKADGSLRTLSRTFNRVKLEAEDQKLLEVGQALGGLLKKPLHEVRVLEESILRDDNPGA